MLVGIERDAEKGPAFLVGQQLSVRHRCVLRLKGDDPTGAAVRQTTVDRADPKCP